MSKNKKIYWSVVTIAVILAGSTVLFIYLRPSARTSAADQNAQGNAAQVSMNVACLGHIEPADGVAVISARSLSGQPSIIGALKVREGDRVTAGQVLAVLDSRVQLEAVVDGAQKRSEVAQARLAVVQAGARTGDITAEEAEIARVEGQLAHEKSEFARYDSIYQKQALTASEHDQRALAVRNTELVLEQDMARLASMKEVREVDLRLAEAEVGSATADVERAKRESEASVIHAPFSGLVLKIHAHLGEEVGQEGLLELANTEPMYVVAEVYESDLSRVRKGQVATISGDALGTMLKGKVESLGNEIAKNNVINLDPVSLTDTRVVEAKIRLDDSSLASHLIHAKVKVLIQP